MKDAVSVAPARWKFDDTDWWLEKHGLIMEQPIFPLPRGKYRVTGARTVTAAATAFDAATSTPAACHAFTCRE